MSLSPLLRSLVLCFVILFGGDQGWVQCSDEGVITNLATCQLMELSQFQLMQVSQLQSCEWLLMKDLFENLAQASGRYGCAVDVANAKVTGDGVGRCVVQRATYP